MSEATYLVGDVFDRMAELPDASVDLIVTSPPFLALRSYLPPDHPDKRKEIGSEATPAAFLSTLLALTREWRRILAPHGSICVELGDTYSGSGGGGGDYLEGGLREGQPGFGGSADRQREGNALHWRQKAAQRDAWPLPKSLCLLPTLYPASLAYGRNLLDPPDTIEPWRVRNLIVWHRPNPPVGALGDKVRPSTSYITTACISGQRWFDLDAERTPHLSNNTGGTGIGSVDGGSRMDRRFDEKVYHPAGAPPLDCWTIPTAPYQGSHYATFPPALPRKLINLMCPRQVCTVCGEPRRRITDTDRVEPSGKNGKDVVHRTGGAWAARMETTTTTLGWTDCACPCDCYPPHTDEANNTSRTNCKRWRRGVVLDPFAGSGTTLMAASELGRDSIGIDLDERNLHLARERCGMFLTEAS